MRKHRFIPKARVVDKDREILKYAVGKSVLHIGMGGYVNHQAFTEAYLRSDLSKTLHGKLHDVADHLAGLDVNPIVLDAMRHRVPGEYFLCDVTSNGLPQEIAQEYDLIVFADVLERLDCFHGALRNLKALLKDGGILIVTTVNAYYIDAIIKLLFRYESVHEEHTSYFSYSTIRRLLESNGLRLTSFMFYTKETTRFDSPFHRLGYTLSKCLSRVLPQYSMGLIAVAQKERS